MFGDILNKVRTTKLEMENRGLMVTHLNMVHEIKNLFDNFYLKALRSVAESNIMYTLIVPQIYHRTNMHYNKYIEIYIKWYSLC